MTSRPPEQAFVIEGLAYKYLVTALNTHVAGLMEKSKGRFCPKKNTPGYLVVPKDKEWLLELANEYEFSLRRFCQGVWPNMQIINPSQIDIVFKDGEWKEEHLPDDTWAIIDRMGYGDPMCGKDSFELFKV